jgi:hypothetical protein
MEIWLAPALPMMREWSADYAGRPALTDESDVPVLCRPHRTRSQFPSIRAAPIPFDPRILNRLACGDYRELREAVDVSACFSPK